MDEGINTTPCSLVVEPIGQQLPAHLSVLMRKPYYLSYHFLLLQNKNKSTASIFATTFVSALSFALQKHFSTLKCAEMLTRHQTPYSSWI